MKYTPLFDYRHEDIQKKICDGEIEGTAAPYTSRDPPIPPSCVGIAICRGRSGYQVILDPDDGYIYWGDPEGQHDEPAPELNSTLARKMKKAGWPGDRQGRKWDRPKFERLVEQGNDEEE
ncbi:hypothetical protein CFIO01_03261 [Colletotrichum fioriniae PJ7]|uniref:Uncharacterized protein n=1 Tax=Colletotrichum fioriniae PJ7 TaxID=1445577 RepID=A0A010R906_9PEZI|nr:hypothetical protein CFIO01_03261 [Colletotrichum fioriniae PJ7]